MRSSDLGHQRLEHALRGQHARTHVARRAGPYRYALGPMGSNDFAQPQCNFVQSELGIYIDETTVGKLLLGHLQTLVPTVTVVQVHAGHAFDAKISLGQRVVLVAASFDDFPILYVELHAAVTRAAPT